MKTETSKTDSAAFARRMIATDNEYQSRYVLRSTSRHFMCVLFALLASHHWGPTTTEHFVLRSFFFNFRFFVFNRFCSFQFSFS